MRWQLPTRIERDDMHTESDVSNVPASLQRRTKEPVKLIQLRIPLSWADELSDLAREYNQDVSTFLREATEDWLKRARKATRSSEAVINR